MWRCGVEIVGVASLILGRQEFQAVGTGGYV